jgi:2-oxoglutarate dehydrogenase complex dehydrogenase (E1) component-like enzyme
LPIAVHGDAAVAGQGIYCNSFQMAQLGSSTGQSILIDK